MISKFGGNYELGGGGRWFHLSQETKNRILNFKC